MSQSRRTILAAGASGLASLAAGAPTKMQDHIIGPIVADLVRKSEKANAALMRGDIDTYLSLITLSDDFTLMSPFGGGPSHGPYTRE